MNQVWTLNELEELSEYELNKLMNKYYKQYLKMLMAKAQHIKKKDFKKGTKLENEARTAHAEIDAMELKEKCRRKIK